MPKIHFSRWYIASALALSAVVPSFAGFNYARLFNKGNPNATTGNAIWRSAQYIDFSSTSTSARNWTTMTGGMKYFLYEQTPSPGNQCYEISTSQYGNGSAFPAQTTNGDTRLWIYDPNQGDGNYSVNDDFGGTYYSKVRIWTGPSSDIIMKVAAYSTSYNSMDFWLITSRLNLTSASACKGSGISFVDASVWPYQYTP